MKKKKLLSFVLGILIGGENIDWSLPASVEHVCGVLGVKKSKVYNVSKVVCRICTSEVTKEK